ncbi:MAG: alpha/beta fold hydrolase [Chloroflexi bacterium]|nr:alpha/beta fold hydrolase [Chloroflexota bacterium]
MSSIPDWYTLGYVDGLKHDFRLIMLDPRGQGESDKPHSTEAYTPEQRVDDVVAVLDAAAVERTHFWGYSLGGRVGFDVAVLRPDRLVSVILGGSSPFESPPKRGLARVASRWCCSAYGFTQDHTGLQSAASGTLRAVARQRLRSPGRGSACGATEPGGTPRRNQTAHARLLRRSGPCLRAGQASCRRVAQCDVRRAAGTRSYGRDC